MTIKLFLMQNKMHFQKCLRVQSSQRIFSIDKHQRGRVKKINLDAPRAEFTLTKSLCRSLLSLGVIFIMPTKMKNNPSKMDKLLSTIDAMMRTFDGITKYNQLLICQNQTPATILGPRQGQDRRQAFNSELTHSQRDVTLADDHRSQSQARH